MKTANSDEQLMLQYAKGNEDAFKELYSRHKGALFRYCIRSCTNLSIAEECNQEIWMKLIRARKNYQSKAKFTTFLYRIAQNHIIDLYRKEKKRKSECEFDDNMNCESDFEVSGSSTDGNQQEALRNSINVLRNAIGKLPFEQKNTLLLKMDKGLTIDQIAEITQSKKESVKSRLRYATAKLKQYIDANELNEIVLSKGKQ